MAAVPPTPGKRTFNIFEITKLQILRRAFLQLLLRSGSIETTGASWSGVASLMGHCRLYDEVVFNEKAVPEIVKLAAAIEKRAPALDPFLFNFNKKTDALYKLVMPILPVDLVTEFRQTEGESNGFELFRKIT